MSQPTDPFRPVQVFYPIGLIVVTAAITWGTTTAESDQTRVTVNENRVDIRAVTLKTAELDKQVALNIQQLETIQANLVTIQNDTKQILTMMKDN